MGAGEKDRKTRRVGFEDSCALTIGVSRLGALIRRYIDVRSAEVEVGGGDSAHLSAHGTGWGRAGVNWARLGKEGMRSAAGGNDIKDGGMG